MINGPIRDKIQMNYGIGAMGPFNQPNAVIGRAWTLMSKNLDGGGIAGETYMGSQGTVINYNNLIIPENEKDSPWPPFHVQKGFKTDGQRNQLLLRFSAFRRGRVPRASA